MAAVPDPISALAAWYASQCNGEWERSFGIVIETLDNAIWSVRIDLAETALMARAFERVAHVRGKDDWVICWLATQQFNATCAPRSLAEALTIFLRWAQ